MRVPKVFDKFKEAGFRECDHKELAVALVKHYGLHEGLWRVGFKFDLRAANINLGGGRGQVPAAFIPIVGINISRVEQMDDLTVDADAVNPEARIIVPGTSLN